jgi:hypothetical protein
MTVIDTGSPDLAISATTGFYLADRTAEPLRPTIGQALTISPGGPRVVLMRAGMARAGPGTAAPASTGSFTRRSRAGSGPGSLRVHPVFIILGMPDESATRGDGTH